jgi:hypothetical protein
MHILKQSTAATAIVGPILDSTGAVYTGAAIGDLNLTKNGTTAAMAAAATLTHDHNGHYLLAMTTGNTDTLGRLVVTCNKSTYAMPPMIFSVLSANNFDMLITLAAGSANGWPMLNSAGYVPADLQTIKTQAVTCSGGVTVPAATLASTTNITAGTIATVTNLTNAPTVGDFTATMKTSIGTAVAASAVASVTAAVTLPSIPANWITAAGINAAALNGKGDWLLSSGYTAPPAASAIATAVWQDATAGDFTVASSIGKALYVANVVPGAAGGHFIAGSNAATTVNFTGNLSGSVGSVTAAVTLPTIPTDWISAAGVSAAAVTKIQTGLATPTNITAAAGITLAALTHTGAVIPTVTNLTNAPTSGDLTATMKTSVTTACTASTPTAAAVTGAVGSVTAAVTLPSIPTNWITAAGIATDAIGAAELAADAATEIAAAVLDAFATASDSVQASPSPTTTAFAGSSSLSSTDNFYVGAVVLFTSGALDGLARKVTAYTGSTRLITVTAPWPSAPVAAATFRILGRID